MANAIPTPLSCDQTCAGTSSITTTPGPAGADGAAGAAGTDGENAFSTVANYSPGAQPVMPAEGASQAVTTTDPTNWAPVGSVVFAEFWGWMQVTAKGSNSITLLNLENTGSGTYAGNAAPGTSLPAAARISQSGPQGPAGTVPGGVLLSANNLSDVADPATSRSNLSLGTAAVVDTGVDNGEVPTCDGTLNSGDVVFCTGTKIGTQDATATRAALGIGSAGTKNLGTSDEEVPPVDQIAGLTDGDAVFATADGLETLTAAAARAALGITSTGFPMLLFQHKASAGADGGNFSTGSWQTVPINSEVVDTDNQGSIAGNDMTLLAGTYRYRYGVLGFKVDVFQGRLYNVTDAAVISNSYSTVCAADSGVASGVLTQGEGRFTIADTKTIRVQANCTSTQLSNGFGEAGNFGGDEVYSFIELWQEG